MMRMRFDLGFASALTLAALLSACSTQIEKPYFRSEGVSAPVSNCSVDPRSFGNIERIPDFSEQNGCGGQNVFKIYDISGVTFSQPAIVRCDVANTLAEWIANTVQPRAKAIFGQNIVSFKIAASYACRPRNNVRGAKLSEHGLANAIDIAAFTLANGEEISVLDDWYSGSSENRAFLRAIRSEACGPFHTVLGPGSDAEHKDHIHLDLQKERGGGPYCH